MRLTRFFQIAILSLFLVAGGVQVVSAQKGSYIYLQSEEQQPFYVTVNGRNISSSSIGYVILSKIPDGDLPLRIGFPNSNTVQDYDVKMAGNDQGFLIKNFGEKGWGLFNLQSLDVQISGVALGKRGKEMAAQKAIEEKRIADSVAVEVAKADAIKKADSIKNALAVQELELKRLESISQIAAANEEETKRLDSIKAAGLAAEKAKAEGLAASKAAAKTADSTAKAVAANAKNTKKKGVADKTKKVVPVATEVAADAIITVDSPGIVAATPPAKEKAQPSAKDTKKKDIVGKKTETPAKEIVTGAEITGEVLAAETAAAVAAEKEATQTKKKAGNTKKDAVSKIDEAVTDSGKIIVYKDGTDTVKAYFDDSKIATTERANDDTIVIKIPARPKKIVDSAAIAAKGKEAAVQEYTVEIVPKAAPVVDKRFLDIQINHDSALIKPETKPEEVAAKVDTVITEKITAPTVESKEPKKEGLTPNNSNTKIVTATDSANGPKTKEMPPVVESANDSSKGKKAVGLTSNNPNTKIVVVPPVIAENAPAEKPKEEIATTEVIATPAEKLKEEAVVKTDSAATPTATAPVATNLACKDVATERDFFAVRKSMVMGADSDEMILAAKKAFKEKCYSTAQVRNLCVLLLSDADRYSFLDMAYPFTSDANNYASLSDLLKDSYFLNRFKAMLK